MLLKSPVKTVDTFIYSLAEQNWEQVQKITSGKALQTIDSQRKQGAKLSTARVVDLDIKVKAASKNWAAVSVKAETELTDGDIDVLWYDLSLQKTDGTWKVNRTVLRLPEIKGKSNLKQISSKEIQAIEQVFINYLTETSQKNYKEAARYLIGYTRQLFELNQFVFNNNAPFKEFNIEQVQPVWHKDNMVVIELTSVIDERQVKNLITAYKTSKDGWKIADIATA